MKSAEQAECEDVFDSIRIRLVAAVSIVVTVLYGKESNPKVQETAAKHDSLIAEIMRQLEANGLPSENQERSK